METLLSLFMMINSMGQPQLIQMLTLRVRGPICHIPTERGQSDIDSGSSTSVGFPQFMKLPEELRRQIWFAAAGEPLNSLVTRVSESPRLWIPERYNIGNARTWPSTRYWSGYLVMKYPEPRVSFQMLHEEYIKAAWLIRQVNKEACRWLGAVVGPLIRIRNLVPCRFYDHSAGALQVVYSYDLGPRNFTMPAYDVFAFTEQSTQESWAARSKARIRSFRNIALDLLTVLGGSGNQDLPLISEAESLPKLKRIYVDVGNIANIYYATNRDDHRPGEPPSHLSGQCAFHCLGIHPQSDEALGHNVDFSSIYREIWSMPKRLLGENDWLAFRNPEVKAILESIPKACAERFKRFEQWCLSRNVQVTFVSCYNV
ncbi:hypothetical protein BJ170DRAFT_463489 [Xylariales sp. AK1849]|nr:hypothetical protein BJ170DRAFT_463489 [Xylariales sp. AK1849]